VTEFKARLAADLIRSTHSNARSRYTKVSRPGSRYGLCQGEVFGSYLSRFAKREGFRKAFADAHNFSAALPPGKNTCENFGENRRRRFFCLGRIWTMPAPNSSIEFRKYHRFQKPVPIGENFRDGATR